MLWPIRSRAARMSASEITIFKVYPLRYRLRARSAVAVSANLLRGAFGKVLHREDLGAYRRYFKPTAAAGPSGLRDSPRPFVLRASHFEGASLAAGDEFEIGVNLFEVRHPPLELFRRVVAALLPAELLHAEETPLCLSLDPDSAIVPRLRVRFLTPTELKGAERPDFAVLFPRIRDRVSTLRALYGDGPLEIDFKAMGQRAEQIRMTLCELQHVASTGSRYPLDGFTGVAEYEGELAEFVPYLEAARYTGVGRQTVWGKGEINHEVF
jgi:hypothetical protein